VTTQRELHDAVQHVGRVTGDPTAWTRGLTPADIALVGLVVAPEAETAAVLDKIKANHPALFGNRPDEPPRPSEAPTAEPQQGAGITAIKKAEDDLAHQNSSTAQVDLLVITAILNAHTTTEQGNAELRRLQSDVEQAVRVRTDLDTPAGARDFQRFLIGKLREIGAVVQTASLDDRSKAVLATAWTALYESSTPDSPEAKVQPPRPVTSTAQPAPAPLPPYGADLGSDPLLEQLLAQDPLTAAVPGPSASPAAPSAAAAPVPPGGMAGLPMLGSPAGGFGPPAGGLGLPSSGLPSLTAPQSQDDLGLPTRDGPASLEDLLAEAEAVLAEEPEELEARAETAEDEPDEPASDEPESPPLDEESAEVRLPNGDRITAPTPELAKVISTALTGTPVGEAFQRHGFTIAPPGSPVTDPVDPAEVSTGDVGMFTDRQALALDRTQALLGGEIQPLASVSGPSFLGWMHPPQTPNSAPSTDAPAPTRPATTPAT
jgi:hypothetical protein